MKDKHYDIFISYRRTSYETANLIATRLKAAGYSVFFDMETLRAGKFNEQLFTVIENCKDFLVVLPPNALDRCADEDDWVRLEVCKAMQTKKNIIPIMLNGFVWLNPMPKGMEELPNYQALTANSIEYFDLSIERLQKRYLTSKPHIPILKFSKLIGLWITSLLIILGIIYGVFYFLSLNVCQKYATILTNDASNVYIITAENQSLQKDWNEFVDDLKRKNNPENIAHKKDVIIQRINLTEKELNNAWRSDSVNIKINDWHSFLLSLHGINAEEIAFSPVFATMYYKDYLEQLCVMRNAAIESNTFNIKFVEMLFDAFPHSINAYYASVLSELSHFPKSSLITFNELSSYWFYFPKNYKQGENADYYETIILSESRQAEELMNRFSQTLEIQNADLTDLEIRTKQLEQKIQDSFAEMETNMVNNKTQVDTGFER